MKNYWLWKAYISKKKNILQKHFFMCSIDYNYFPTFQKYRFCFAKACNGNGATLFHSSKVLGLSSASKIFPFLSHAGNLRLN